IYEGETDIGANNIAWALNYLDKEGMKPVKTDVGDIYPRKIYYFTESGRLLLKRIERIRNRTIFDREKEYQETLQKKKGGDVELF
ncbi:MAG: hypothetical protein WAO55_02940, partial [Candidatus Manganitrophaceae bacterium]